LGAQFIAKWPIFDVFSGSQHVSCIIYLHADNAVRVAKMKQQYFNFRFSFLLLSYLQKKEERIKQKFPKKRIKVAEKKRIK